MSTARLDVVVIGGGIHGAGVAQAAAAGGYSVRVLEKTGVANATSCRSSKLIHGGLRYLENGQFGLVRESLYERDLLLRNAPSLVRLVPFHIPVYRSTHRGRLTIRAGLSLYALLGNLRPNTRFDTLPRRQWDSLDGLETHGLKAVFRYYDGQTDDATLTQAVMRSAQTLGAELACPAEFLHATRTSSGYGVRYHSAGGEQECECAVLVNAAGPWVNTVLAGIEPHRPPPAIELVQGTHIVLDGALTQGVYYTEAEDRRAVLIMPWRSLTLVGTTETRLTGDPAQARPLPEETDYLLRTFRRHFPQRDIHVRDQFAGVRVLPRGTGSAFHRPRETVYLTDSQSPPRLVNIYGGKLTGYRATAVKALALLRPALPARRAQADTASLRIGD